ncbi:hypothetical protein OS190_09270 [Sulfitobacter sp. F26204]|uniref:hypothetical protein n=1 Tax=Sulfitobacter sp. F26204 TaxID=2996014 RepID=UPI00225E27E0|nr:hypothetical protein [Sulfitobacter sp. F26204]MCX7559756.1 hypothetical protein [Sulfitobacter sp. F26204]
MTDDIPQIILGLGEDSEYVVMVGAEEAEATTLATLMKLAPELRKPEAAAEAARAINYLSQGAAFRVIEDPAAFEAQYRKTLASEDPNAPWAEGVIRLSDYGVPDFTTIKAPGITGTVLTYFAVDDMLGLPYRIEVDLGSSNMSVTDDQYKALDLEPLEFGDEQQMPTPVNPEEDDLSKMMESGIAGDD